MRVELTAAEIAEAVRIGEKRQSHNRDRIRDQRICSSDSTAIHVSGAKAERAVAKLTGYKWHAFKPEFCKVPRHKRRADVGPIEVRAKLRAYATNYLVFRDKDDDRRPYLLLTPASGAVFGGGAFEVVGWRFGFECRRAEFRREDYYSIPDQALCGLASLEAWCVSYGWDRWQKRATAA